MPKNRFLKRFVEHYIVDYIKHIIKHKTIPAQTKFNALLLLKETLKTKSLVLVKHTSSKILKRLVLLAVSPLEDKCLLEFNNTADQNWSTNFHYLNRESIFNWSQELKLMDVEYVKAAQKLFVARRLPIEKKYWDYPESIFVKNTKDMVILEEKIKSLRQHRRDIKNYLLSDYFFGMKDQDLEKLANNYMIQHSQITNDEFLHHLVNQPSAKLVEEERKLVENANQETLFCEQFQAVYLNSKNSPSPKEFLNQYEDINKVFFEGEEISVKRKLESIDKQNDLLLSKKPASSIIAENSLDNKIKENKAKEDLPIKKLEPKEEFHEKATDDPHSRQMNNNIKDNSFNLPQDLKIHKKEVEDDFSNDNIRQEYPQFIDKASATNRNQMDKLSSLSDIKNPMKNNKFDPTLNFVAKENEELAREIEALESKKKMLEEKVRDQRDQKIFNARPSRNPSTQMQSANAYDGIGFYNILKSQDRQIDNIDFKLRKLQNEYRKVTHEQNSINGNTPTTRMFVKPSEINPLLNYQSNRTDFRRTIYNEIGIERVPLSGNYSSSAFVDQLYNDINKVLKKPSRLRRRVLDSPAY